VSYWGWGNGGRPFPSGPLGYWQAWFLVGLAGYLTYVVFSHSGSLVESGCITAAIWLYVLWFIGKATVNDA